jgi:hypothetical protein
VPEEEVELFFDEEEAVVPDEVVELFLDELVDVVGEEELEELGLDDEVDAFELEVAVPLYDEDVAVELLLELLEEGLATLEEDAGFLNLSKTPKF